MAFSFMEGDRDNLPPFLKIIFNLDILCDKHDCVFSVLMHLLALVGLSCRLFFASLPQSFSSY
jgi:hypothetical protein